MEFLTLNTGAKMPLEGFGVFQIPDATQMVLKWNAQRGVSIIPKSVHMGTYKEKQRRDMWKCLNFGTL